MICPCGGMTKNYHHKTVDGVNHWVSRCPACGRRHEVNDKKQDKPESDDD